MGWAFTLTRASLRVIGEHRRLVVFPIVSGVATIAVILATALPIVGHVSSPVSWALIAVGYFVLSLITIFCNAALVHAANLALRGERATVAAGFRGAFARFGAIALWALISCTVTLLLRALRAVRLGELLEAILGVAWHITTYLVIPLIVVEHDSVPTALRRSKNLLRSTWGTNFSGTVGIGVALGLSALAGMAILIGVGVLVNVLAHNPAAAFPTAGPAIGLWLVVLIVLGGTISAVFRTALYRFAADGTIVPQFREIDLSTTFD